MPANHYSWRALSIAIGVAVLGSAWFGRSDTPPASPPTAGERIIAFGDSLVEGVGASPDHDVVSVLSRRLGVPIINAGRRGDTTAAALVRLDRAVLSRNPRVVLVLLGGNDVLRRVPKQTTFENLATIVARIRARGAAVVLVGVKVGLFSDTYGAEYTRVARALSADSSRMSDGVHPNDRGYEMMADRLEPVLRDLVQ